MSSGSERTVSAAEEVAQLIRSRSNSHGDAVGQHRTLAGLWSAYLGQELTVWDAVNSLILLQMSRQIEGDRGERDHVLDIAGYAAIGVAAFDDEAA